MDRGNSKSKRVYQVWKGNNKFMFGGRLIFGPNVFSLFLSVLLILVPAVAFSVKTVFTIDDKKGTAWYLIPVVAILLTLLDLLFLFLTSGRDPGIVPRNKRPPECDESIDINAPSLEWFDDRTPRAKLPRTRDVIVNGHTVTVKFCDTCLVYRSPRTSHCSVCNNCVQRFDHHCPWVSQCIGIRNYRFYYMFILTSAILCAYVFAISWYDILHHRGTLWEAMLHNYLFDALILYCFLAFWFVGGLLLYHSYLICNNKTTYENFRSQYIKLENPYNRGMIKNVTEIFFSKIPRSLIDLRAVAEEDKATEPTGSKEIVGIEMGAMRKRNTDLTVPDKSHDVTGRKTSDHLIEKMDAEAVTSLPSLNMTRRIPQAL